MNQCHTAYSAKYRSHRLPQFYNRSYCYDSSEKERVCLPTLKTNNKRQENLWEKLHHTPDVVEIKRIGWRRREFTEYSEYVTRTRRRAGRRDTRLIIYKRHVCYNTSFWRRRNVLSSNVIGYHCGWLKNDIVSARFDIASFQW